MAIDKVKIRARVEVGSLRAYTPSASVGSSDSLILSFNVNRSRGQVSTFDARLKVPANQASDVTKGEVKIYAGSGYASRLIFTGIARKATITPCFDDPHYVIMNISGADVLSLLQNKKYTRRCVATQTAWASIDGVSRRGLRSGKFKYKNQPVLLITDDELNESRQLIKSANLPAFKKDFSKPSRDAGSGAARIFAEPIIVE
jgi:hypothetical protein